MSIQYIFFSKSKHSVVLSPSFLKLWWCVTVILNAGFRTLLCFNPNHCLAVVNVNLASCSEDRLNQMDIESNTALWLEWVRRSLKGKKDHSRAKSTSSSSSSWLVQYWSSSIVATVQPISASVQLGARDFWCTTARRASWSISFGARLRARACCCLAPHNVAPGLVALDNYNQRSGMYHRTTPKSQNNGWTLVWSNWVELFMILFFFPRLLSFCLGRQFYLFGNVFFPGIYCHVMSIIKLS